MRVSVRKPAKMKLRNKFNELQMDSDLETSNQPEAKNKLSSNAQMLSVDKEPNFENQRDFVCVSYFVSLQR